MEADDFGKVAWLGIIVGEKVMATMTVVKVLIYKTGERANPIRAADVGVVAVVVFRMDLGQI